jgi:putative ABC transport system substrate-binding protein
VLVNSQKHKKLFIVSILLLTPFFFCLNKNVGATEADKIVVLKNQNTEQYTEVQDGVKKYFRSKDVPIKLFEFSLQDSTSNATEIIQKIKNHKPKLIVCLGSLASDIAGKQIKGIPVISAMVLRPLKQEEAANRRCLFLEHPLEVQLEWLQRFLPKAKNIGVLYHPDANKDMIDKADKLFTQHGLTLLAHEVNSPQEIPIALKTLTRKVDVLWGVADKLVFNAKTAKYLLLFSFRNRIPLIGLSSPWVKAGALYALSWDYEDMGKQCGEMALEILQNKTAGSTSPVGPRKVEYSVNLKTAERMKLVIPETLIKEAKTIY